MGDKIPDRSQKELEELEKDLEESMKYEDSDMLEVIYELRKGKI